MGRTFRDTLYIQRIDQKRPFKQICKERENKKGIDYNSSGTKRN